MRGRDEMRGRMSGRPPVAPDRSPSGESARHAVSDIATRTRDTAVAAVAEITPRMRGVLHQWAFIVSFAAGIVLVARAGSMPARIVAVVYAVSLTACLGISAYYHRHRWSPVGKRRMRKVDRAMIFILIAGTYTPIAALTLPHQLALMTLSVVWLCAAGGMALTTLWPSPPAIVEIGPYVVLGVAGAGLTPSLLPSLGLGAVLLLAAGGALYVTGAVVYAQHRPDPWPSTFGFHEVFHVLVLLAAGIHYTAISWVVHQP
jgi:hemolysin III